MEDPIVKPPPRGGKPPIPPLIVLVATQADLQRLRKRLALTDDKGEPLYLSRIYLGPQTPAFYAIVGPFMGAPQAAMLMETLSAWGAMDFLFLGWCGAIDHRLRTGDILLPTAALIEEGTSRGYGVNSERVALPSADLHEEIKNAFLEDNIAFKEGIVWSTDAVFHETSAKVRAFRNRGALAVEMEISACLTVARLRGVRFAAALAVSDELSDLSWRPGFRAPRFKAACQSVSRIMEQLCLMR